MKTTITSSTVVVTVPFYGKVTGEIATSIAICSTARLWDAIHTTTGDSRDVDKSKRFYDKVYDALCESGEDNWLIKFY